MADKSRKFSKPRGYDDIENMRCILHPKGNHTTGNCYTFNERYTRKDNKVNTKEDNQKKDEDNHEGKGFQKSRGTVAVIFAGGSRFQKQTSRKASTTNHRGSGTGYSKISQLVTVSNPIFKRRPMD